MSEMIYFHVKCCHELPPTSKTYMLIALRGECDCECFSVSVCLPCNGLETCPSEWLMDG